MQEIKYLVIIPARGGSKRIPGKNMIPLNDQPLLHYTLKAALNSQRISHEDIIFVSTDSREIAKFSESQTILVPFLRPESLAASESSISDTVQHCLEEFKQRQIIAKNVILLQPTSPFRTAHHIDEAIEIFETQEADTLISVKELSDHPYWSWTISNETLIPFFSREKMAFTRSNVPPAMIENGAILIVKSEIVRRKKVLYGKRIIPYPMDQESSLDIDTEHDLKYAEYLLKKEQNEKDININR